MVQTLNFEELHDSVRGDVVDFQELVISNTCKLGFGVYQDGRLKVSDICSGVIIIDIILDDGKVTIPVTIFKDENFKIVITY